MQSDRPFIIDREELTFFRSGILFLLIIMNRGAERIECPVRLTGPGAAPLLEQCLLISQCGFEFLQYEASKLRGSQGSQEAYFAALRAHGTEVITLPAIPGYPDCSFTEDTAVIIDDKAVIPNLGHPSRDGEQDSIADFLSEDFEIVRMPKGATLDGGDVVFYDDRFLVGISTRTNQRGAVFLADQAKKSGFDVQLFDVPKNTLHLTTVCSSPRQGQLASVGYLKSDLSFAESCLDTEDEGYASNTIAYRDRIIIPEGYKKARRLMLDSGFSVTTVEMSEFREVDASLTCLSVFIG